MKEAPFIIALLFFVAGAWWLIREKTMRIWAWFWTSVAALVIGFEIQQRVMTGRTLSQHFWYWGRDHIGQAWLLSACMLVSILILVYHLMAGAYKRRK